MCLHAYCRWVCPPHSLLFLVCFVWTNMEHASIRGEGHQDRKGRDRRRSEEERWKLNGGTFIETERVSEAALPPAPWCNYKIIVLFSHLENVSVWLLNATCAPSFILPQVFTTASVSSIRQTQRSTCLAAQKPEVQRYTNKTPARASETSQHILSQRRSPQGECGFYTKQCERCWKCYLKIE